MRADVARSGERHEVDARMRHERVAERTAGTEDEVEHALRQSGLDQDLDQADREHRRVGRGLEHDRVAEHERRHDLPRRDCEREVPGRDRGHDTERCAHRHRPLVRELGRHDVTELPAALAGGVVGHVDALLDVAAGLGEDLAHLGRHRAGEVVLALEHDLAGAIEDLASLGRGDETPRLERPPCGVDRAVDLGLRRLRRGRDDLARRGVEPLEGLAAR